MSKEKKDFFEKYEQLLQILRFSTKEILLMEPFLFPYPAEFSTWEPERIRMSEGIRLLAEQYHCSFLPLQDLLLSAAEKEGFSAITLDGVHLTRRGQELLTEQLKPFIFSRKQERNN